jgi:hypothetical protein
MSDKKFVNGQRCYCIQRGGPWPVVTAGKVVPPPKNTGDWKHFMRVQFGITGQRHTKTVAKSNSFHTEEDAILALQVQLRQELMLWDHRLDDIRFAKKEVTA